MTKLIFETYLIPSKASTFKFLNLVDTLAISVLICNVSLPSAEALITTSDAIVRILSIVVLNCFRDGSSIDI